MTGYRSERVVSIVPFLIVATTLLAIGQPRIARAINPDIPRMQAGAERGSVQQQKKAAAWEHATWGSCTTLGSAFQKMSCRPGIFSNLELNCTTFLPSLIFP